MVQEKEEEDRERDFTAKKTFELEQRYKGKLKYDKQNEWDELERKYKIFTWVWNSYEAVETENHIKNTEDPDVCRTLWAILVKSFVWKQHATILQQFQGDSDKNEAPNASEARDFWNGIWEQDYQPQ